VVVGRESADDPDGAVRVIGVGDPPQLMVAGLPDSLEGRTGSSALVARREKASAIGCRRDE
jgi:hypothetical protein